MVEAEAEAEAAPAVHSHVPLQWLRDRPPPPTPLGAAQCRLAVALVGNPRVAGDSCLLDDADLIEVVGVRIHGYDRRRAAELTCTQQTGGHTQHTHVTACADIHAG